jgi:hypothetical protein
MLTMLQIARNTACKDPRDKFYAIRGLIAENFSNKLPTDYSIHTTAAWIYVQLAAIHLFETSRLDILAYTQLHRDAKDRPLITGVESPKPQEVLANSITLPSWVPDWNTAAIDPLPALCFTTTKIKWPILPQILTRADKRMILQSELFNVPLDSILKVRGRRVGTLWPDTVIFRRDSKTRLPSPKESNWQINWIMNPSPHEASQNCARRQAFWEHFSWYIYNTHNELPGGNHADIPPAFGGFCAACFAADLNSWKFIRETRRFESGLLPLLACLCHADTRVGVEKESQIPAPHHYFEARLHEFGQIFKEHGMHRRLFGTEHSLGFGPSNVEFGDSVWLLDGARAPVILRPADGAHYTVVGECYLYDVDSEKDTCAHCGRSSPRVPINRDIKFEEDGMYVGTQSYDVSMGCFVNSPSNGRGNLISKTESNIETIEIW